MSLKKVIINSIEISFDLKSTKKNENESWTYLGDFVENVDVGSAETKGRTAERTTERTKIIRSMHYNKVPIALTKRLLETDMMTFVYDIRPKFSFGKTFPKKHFQVSGPFTFAETTQNKDTVDASLFFYVGHYNSEKGNAINIGGLPCENNHILVFLCRTKSWDEMKPVHKSLPNETLETHCVSFQSLLCGVSGEACTIDEISYVATQIWEHVRERRNFPQDNSILIKHRTQLEHVQNVYTNYCLWEDQKQKNSVSTTATTVSETKTTTTTKDATSINENDVDVKQKDVQSVEFFDSMKLKQRPVILKRHERTTTNATDTNNTTEVNDVNDVNDDNDVNDVDNVIKVSSKAGDPNFALKSSGVRQKKNTVHRKSTKKTGTKEKSSSGNLVSNARIQKTEKDDELTEDMCSEEYSRSQNETISNNTKNIKDSCPLFVQSLGSEFPLVQERYTYHANDTYYQECQFSFADP